MHHFEGRCSKFILTLYSIIIVLVFNQFYRATNTASAQNASASRQQSSDDSSEHNDSDTDSDGNTNPDTLLLSQSLMLDHDAVRDDTYMTVSTNMMKGPWCFIRRIDFECLSNGSNC